jgi:hypothetical protein
MAPEIGKRDGPARHLYRADLWTCSRVISYLMVKNNEEVEKLKALSWRLLNVEPQICSFVLYVDYIQALKFIDNPNVVKQILLQVLVELDIPPLI